MNEVQERNRTLIERLREKDWRMTAQRRAVAEVLSGSNLHLPADEIYKRARDILPEISRATVYNTLGELVDMGELEEVQFNPGPTLFDPNARIPHHHLVCSNCGKISDIRPRGLENLRLSREDEQGFSLEEVEVVFRGRCAACRGGREGTASE